MSESVASSIPLFYIWVILALISIYLIIESIKAFSFPKEGDKPIILFDGVCNLCNHFVNFVIDNDPEQRIRFANAQSEEAKALIEKVIRSDPTFDTTDDENLHKHELYRTIHSLDSIVLIVGNQYYIHSDAVLNLFTYLRQPVRSLAALRSIPLFIRTIGYKLVARNRYLLFGQSDSCRRPTKAIRNRFLSPLTTVKT